MQRVYYNIVAYVIKNLKENSSSSILVSLDTSQPHNRLSVVIKSAAMNISDHEKAQIERIFGENDNNYNSVAKILSNPKLSEIKEINRVQTVSMHSEQLDISLLVSKMLVNKMKGSLNFS